MLTRSALAKPTAIKPEEQFARSYVDRLILEKITDMEAVVKLGDLAEKLASSGIGLAVVRSLLASNPERFAYHERRWIPAARLEGQGRPFAEAIKLLLDRFGAPMSLFALSSEVARIRGRSVEDIEPMVRRIITTDDTFTFSVPHQLVALTAWSFDAVDETFERALALNGVTEEEIADAAKKLEDIDWLTANSVEQALGKVAPIRIKALGAIAYGSLQPYLPQGKLTYDRREFLARALAVPGYIYAPDGTLHPEADAKKWISTAIKLADKLAPSVEFEDAAPIEIKTEDSGKLIARISGNEATTPATKLLEEFYEITPGNKTFPDDLANIMTALRGSDQVMWVGGDRFRKAGDFPDYILEVPEPFHYVQTSFKGEDGELIDVELTDEGLSSSLRKLLQHPLAQDVLDEDIPPQPKQMPESIRLVLKSIHRELGTFPMCQFPTNWLDPQPDVQELILMDNQGREAQIWASHESRLLFGFLDWWYEQPVESGAVFTLTKTPRPNVLEFEWLDQPDPVVYISAQRMEELRNLGTEGQERSTLDLLIDVMAHWPKGADFLTIHAELNVVRRSTRRLVASLLSSYQCFYQRSGSPVWHFDAKKVDLGFDKTKRKFVRK
jgi:hypothetical protein